jgi:sugar/nucleoside kinase (ribokinase family)
VDALIINDEELRQLAGEHNVRRAAARVLAMGPKRLIVKRGEYGALLFDEHGIHFTPAYPLEDEVDPTGAGDSFAGALVGYLAAEPALDGATLRRALSVASAVASACVEGVGTSALAALDRAGVTARLGALRALVEHH